MKVAGVKEDAQQKFESPLHRHYSVQPSSKSEGDAYVDVMRELRGCEEPTRVGGGTGYGAWGGDGAESVRGSPEQSREGL